MTTPTATPTWEHVLSQITKLQRANMELRAELTATRATASPTPCPRPSLRIRDPDLFGIDLHQNVRTWLFQVDNYFAAVGLVVDRAKMNFAGTLFRAGALEWWRQLQAASNAANPTLSLPSTWTDFEAAIRGRFELVALNRTARLRLRVFSQVGSVADYTTRFLAL
jgi:hypothetical protein